MVGMMKSFLIQGEGVWTAFVDWRCRFSGSMQSLETKAPFNSRFLGQHQVTNLLTLMVPGSEVLCVRVLGVGVSEWDQRLAKMLLPTKGKGRRSFGLMRRIRLSQRVYKVLECKQCAQGYLQDAGNAVTTLKTCAYEVHNYTSKMQSDTRIANRPLPQQR